jgi:phage terminase large subunit-like protein
MGEDGRVYVRADRSVNASPRTWGERVVQTYSEFHADLVVYESNSSPGKPDVVADTIRTVDPGRTIKWQAIHASRDKRTRADPVASLYEGHKVRHVTDPKDPQNLALLEDELTSWDPSSRYSPNRLDALVHGVSYLTLQKAPAALAGPMSVGTRQSPWRMPR